MYMIGIFVFLGLAAGSAFLSAMPASIVSLPSLLVVLLLSVPVLTAYGLLPDFFRGFRLMRRRVRPISVLQIKRILVASRLAIRTFLFAGGVGTAVGVISLLSRFGGRAGMSPDLGMATLTVLYSLVFVLLVLPVQAKAKAVLNKLGMLFAAGREEI